ncbi:MAG: pilus assembly protein [Neisseria sp.]|uniref:Pilus assembly protein n=1 Tax=Neisseria oralis TaxID=1107316 RepID=A0ABW8Q7S9_9NEIS|nr:pilus assembly protein [uncultured Neisseria sp.]
MRRPHSLIQSKSNQQGFALFIVLMMMVAIALLVVAAMQSYNTEQRISTNDADRKLAFSLAESALREGENAILNLPDSPKFNDECDNGLCRAANTAERPTGSPQITGTSNIEAWLRKCGDKLCIDTKGKEYPKDAKVSLPNGVSKKPRYIIEYVSNSSTGANIYRVTAKAWGKNDNTTVMVQSYVSNE